MLYFSLFADVQSLTTFSWSESFGQGESLGAGLDILQVSHLEGTCLKSLNAEAMSCQVC